MGITINSYADCIGSFPSSWNDEIIKNEPMFFNSDVYYAHRNGGPITRGFLDSLPNDWWVGSVIDTRVHMLKKGWYPCIPGWHHDDVPRSTANFQPNYIDPEYRSEHIMGLVNAEVAPTEFAIGSINLPLRSENIYKQWHPLVEQAIREQAGIYLSKADSGKLIKFDDRTFHQGVKATKDGWRWFARISRNTDRVNFRTNEIRKQVQVYLETPMEGW